MTSSQVTNPVQFRSQVLSVLPWAVVPFSAQTAVTLSPRWVSSDVGRGEMASLLRALALPLRLRPKLEQLRGCPGAPVSSYTDLGASLLSSLPGTCPSSPGSPGPPFPALLRRETASPQGAGLPRHHTTSTAGIPFKAKGPALGRAEGKQRGSPPCCFCSSGPFP